MITTRVVYNRENKEYDVYLSVDGLEAWAGSRKTFGQASAYAVELEHDFCAR